ncbi:MAG: tyrosine-type recombinase/integrase [Bdellovibrionales bacterium]|nr:tyrosine-type recombinase/integrase [Bdellovibrionales bacterium]
MLFQQTEKSKSALLDSFVKFLSVTGMRRSEALDLKWSDVDQANGFFHVRDSKTEGSTRSLPIEDEAWKAIEGLQGNGEHVFSYVDGARPFRDSFLKPLKRAAKQAGFSKSGSTSTPFAILMVQISSARVGA